MQVCSMRTSLMSSFWLTENFIAELIVLVSLGNNRQRTLAGEHAKVQLSCSQIIWPTNGQAACGSHEIES